jgi:hypothetical protein
VDFVTCDHLHTQDLRKWLGANGRPAYFPNARLLVTRAEWESVRGLLPPQRDWYCPDGVEGIDPGKIVLFDDPIRVCDGLALVPTPGHTHGNHSIVANTPEGLLVTSENGVAADSYAPLASRIPGVADHARATGMEVVLNGNTLEGGLEQYVSMLLEREIAGRSVRNDAFFNCAPSSELRSYWAFPGISPTFEFGPMAFGEYRAASAEETP